MRESAPKSLISHSKLCTRNAHRLFKIQLLTVTSSKGRSTLSLFEKVLAQFQKEGFLNGDMGGGAINLKKETFWKFVTPEDFKNFHKGKEGKKKK